MSTVTLLHALGSARARFCTATAAAALVLSSAVAFATPCIQPNAAGTVVMPPANCPYVSPTDFHMIVDGFPVGTTIVIGVEHQRFLNITGTPDPAGGETENFKSSLVMTMNGTGGLAGYSRTLVLPAQCQSHVNPHTPGDPVQSFDTEMMGISGQITGDPDFDLLRVTAGSAFGMPSPGHTTLTLRETGDWNVDSFFDITYRIDFVGRPGGPLGGHSGSTTGTIRMGTGEPAPAPPPPCTVVDNGTGTVNLPPQGCGYVSPADLHMMINGLPPGTTINVDVQHQKFFNVVTHPGGSLGGEVENFNSLLLMQLDGTGDLSDFHRTANMQAQCQTHTAPRTPGQPIQSFDTDMFGIQGQIIGDPDFDLLRITAGTGFSMPSPGHTTLTKIPGTPQWAVDSFFDITYRIDFVGAPAGRLGGRSGSTTGTIRMQAGQPTLVGVPIGQKPLVNKVELINSPNPSDGNMTLQYRLPNTAHVRLSVFDAAGHLVRKLADELTPAGPHAMLWDGRDDAGRRVRSGTFFFKLTVDGEQVASKKAIVIK